MLSTATQPPSGEPSRDLLGWEGASAWEVDEWALEPPACGVGEDACPIVSHRLCDPVEGVVDSASRPLNELSPWNLCTY